MQLIERHNVDAEFGADTATTNVPYLLGGILTDAAAKVALMVNLPAVREGLVLQSFRYSSIGNQLWDVTAKYGKRKPLEVGELEFSFDTTGSSTRITNSNSTVSYGEDPPDFQGAIGVRQDQIEGTEKKFAGLAFQFKKKYKLSDLPAGYLASFYSKTWHVNEATFTFSYKGQDFTYQAGECVFAGATGNSTGDDEFEIMFKFEASPNAADLEVGNITGINKLGWDYLWILYQDATDANFLVRRPRAVYVETIYDTVNFGGIVL